jgi:hypothetical protein
MLQNHEIWENPGQYIFESDGNAMLTIKRHYVKGAKAVIHNPGNCSYVYFACDHSNNTTKIPIHRGTNTVCYCHTSSTCTTYFTTKLIPREQANLVNSVPGVQVEYTLLTQEPGVVEWGPPVPSLTKLCITNCQVRKEDEILKDNSWVAPSVTAQVGAKYEVCFVPRCPRVNVYTCTRFCDKKLGPCMLDMYRNSWPEGHIRYEESKANEVLQKEHYSRECTFSVD